MAFLEPPLKLDPKVLAPAGVLQGQIHRSPHVFTYAEVLAFLKKQEPEAVARLDLRSHQTPWIYKLIFSLRAEKYATLKYIIFSA